LTSGDPHAVCLLVIDIKAWISHGYINKIEGSVPECGREKD